MASFDSNDSRDEALWQLLGKARGVEASPFFTRKVLREIETTPEPVWAQWLRFAMRTFAPVAVCAGIAVVAVIGTGGKVPVVASADIEFETIENLDLLVSNYESSIWLDPSSSSR